MAQKPSTPKGTRDFSPLEMARRNYIFDTIKNAFRIFGYEQIETPAMENLSTLMGKYGEEGDKLLFKILNSGNFLSDISSADIESASIPQIIKKISDKGLRYDLTVPFARFIVQHRGDIQLPFKRFQMQPVWRADRPQKGRYREFYQCDADVVGSESLLNEVELLSLIDYVFDKFKINIDIRLNNRKILAGIAETLHEEDHLIDLTVAIDKIDKIGLDGVTQEMRSKGVSEDAIEKISPLLTFKGNTVQKLDFISGFLGSSLTGKTGVEELKFVIDKFSSLQRKCSLTLDLSLARGLNYYTGTIIEVKALDVEIGSISGGGRYDNLTGVFGLEGIPGVGISFGADRIYDVLNQLNLYPEKINETVNILFLNLGEKEADKAFSIVSDLRQKGVRAMVYPDMAKIKKQMSYANAKSIPYVAIIGSSELENGIISLKNMISGEQSSIKETDIADILR